jgi:diadenosine tetraphosphate (Ap4A) HIT family hydrolase
VTNEDRAGEEVERLIGTAGFEPVKAGGIEQSSRLEVGGDLQDLVVGSGPTAATSRTLSTPTDSSPPGGYVVEGEHFLVEHAPLQESSAGTVILEARRHLLDFGEMTPTESAELGSILHRLVPAIKAATGVQRVYFLAVMERAPHFHLWLVPKKNEGELRGVGYLAQQPPLTASYSAAEEMSRKLRTEFERSSRDLAGS